MSKTNVRDPLRNIHEYLNNLDGIEEYVIVNEGFPVYWGKGIGQERAEELAALATDVVNSSIKYAPVKGKDGGSYQIISEETGSSYISVMNLNKDTIVLAKGEPSIIRHSLINIYRYMHDKLKCPWCSTDLSLHVIVCSNGHRLPMGIMHCPICSERIQYLKCPKCGRPISPDAHKVELRIPRENMIAGILMILTGIVMLALSSLFINIHTLASLILIAAAGVFFGIAYSGLRTKIPVRVD